MTELQGLLVSQCHSRGHTHAFHRRPEQASPSCRRVCALQPNSFVQMGFTCPFLLRHQLEQHRELPQIVPTSPRTPPKDDHLRWARVPAQGVCVGLGWEPRVEVEGLERVQRRLRRRKRSWSKSFQGPGSTNKHKEEIQTLSRKEKT